MDSEEKQVYSARMSPSPLRDGLIGVAIFAGSLPATRIAVEVFDPLSVTAARAALAALAAGLYLLALKRPVPRREHVKPISIASLCLVLGFPWLTALATVTSGAAHGAVILGLLPLATAVMATLFAGERPSLRFWLFALAGAGLVALFAWRNGGNEGFSSGDVLLFVAVGLAALGYAMAGKLSRDMDGVDVIAWQIVGFAPIAFIAVALTWHGLQSPDASLRHWLALGYIALFSQFIGFWFWNRALADGGIARVGQVQLMQTFFSFAIAAAVLGETITIEMLAFGLLVAATVWGARKARVAT
jgi:drug/metabolite transporter (DMT)-like permease